MVYIYPAAKLRSNGALWPIFAPALISIELFDEKQQRTLVSLTNHLKLAAATVAEAYKNRWQIELFFKSLKQPCKVKTFIGTSANALKTQIWRC